MAEEEAYSRPLWPSADDIGVRLPIAIQRINSSAADSANASSQPERLEAVLMYLEAVEDLIEPCDGLSEQSKTFMRGIKKAIVCLQRGYISPQLEPVSKRRNHQLDYKEWNHRALLAYCYYVLRESGSDKDSALEEIERLANECCVELPRGDLEQAIINNFAYKNGDENNQDKYDAIRLYEHMKSEFSSSWYQIKFSKEQAVIWWRRTLERRKDFPELRENDGGHGSPLLFKRGPDGILVPSYDHIIGHDMP